MIPVTKTFLPLREEYNEYLKTIWESQWLTNRGELVVNLENKLKNFLKVENLLLTTNGTIPLQIAVKLLGQEGEVITTPFSYVATAASIVWESCTPVFVDIDPEYLTIDESKIEAAITYNTTAILATHVFGNPCNVEQIGEIARRHDLKVIYDAAHCFGVKYKGISVFDYGDISTCSFHATKLFHTGEGGGVFCKNSELMHKCYYSHNFGHDGQLAFHGLGINGKISELQAAMGLAVLPYVEQIIEDRRRIVDTYCRSLNFSKIRCIRIRREVEWNYSYYPVIFESEGKLLAVQKRLNNVGIFPRRYFYPSLNTLNYTTGGNVPIAESIAKTILCLPLYFGLDDKTVEDIADIINNECW